MELFKINYHSHSRYSDGVNTLEEMVQQSKDLGFCCHVTTDHYYARHQGKYMTLERYEEQVKEAKLLSAKLQFPIFCGLEVATECSEEINVFGADAIRYIITTNAGFDNFRIMRDKFECACILNHPVLRMKEGYCVFEQKGGADIIDGIEIINGHYSMFPEGVPEFLSGKNYFANSDAHYAEALYITYNLINQSVQTETDLINSIKNGIIAIDYLRMDDSGTEKRHRWTL